MTSIVLMTSSSWAASCWVCTISLLLLAYLFCCFDFASLNRTEGSSDPSLAPILLVFLLLHHFIFLRLDTLKFSGMIVFKQGVCSAVGAARLPACVVDIGHTHTSVLLLLRFLLLPLPPPHLSSSTPFLSLLILLHGFLGLLYI